MSKQPASVRYTARLKPLAELVDRCIAPALAAQGFAASDVVLAWPEIVGPRLARHTEPLKIMWPRRGREGASASPATLIVRVTGAFALELQHQAPVVVERVNTHFGWRCIGSLALRQGPLLRRPERQVRELSLAPDDAAELQGAVDDIADDALRLALTQLGTGVLARNR